MFRELIAAISSLARAVHGLSENTNNKSVLKRMEEMENNIMVKVSEIKAAVALAAKNNREAFGELGTRIADLQKQIADLIEANVDPSVTDETFEADLKALGVDAQALADIVPNPNPTTPA